MMSDKKGKRLKGDYETRRRAAGEWFQIALDNAKAADQLAKKKNQKRHALYMMGQSMETATKGIAIGAGVSYKEVTGWRHDFIEGFLALQNTLYENVSLAQETVDVFTHQSAEYGWETGDIHQLRRMLKRTVAPGNRKLENMAKAEQEEARRFYSSMLSLDSDSVKSLLRIWIGMNNRKKRILATGENFLKERLGKEIALKKPPAGEDILDSIANQIIEFCEDRLNGGRLTESQRDYVRLTTIELAKSEESRFINELEESGWRVKTEHIFGKQGEKDMAFDIPLANVGLYLFGIITWPHLTFVRYPAAPDAPKSFEKAATNPQQGRLGAIHYSDQVGVIKHIKELTPKAVDITKRIRKGWEKGLLVPVEPFARSNQN